MDKKLEEKINDLLDELFKRIKKINITNTVEEALKKDAKICITNKKGETTIDIEGDKVTVILLLAGLEKSVLNKLNVPEEMFLHIKKIVGTKEDK